jgi:hypothetical protein
MTGEKAYLSAYSVNKIKISPGPYKGSKYIPLPVWLVSWTDIAPRLLPLGLVAGSAHSWLAIFLEEANRPCLPPGTHALTTHKIWYCYITVDPEMNTSQNGQAFPSYDN